MKILFYSPVDLRSGLGCERWHCDITNSLRQQFGHTIEVVTGNLGFLRWSDAYLSSQLAGIPFSRLKFPVFFSSIVPDPLNFIRLWRKMTAADTVHFIGGFAGQDILMIVLKILTGKPVIVGHHAPLHTASLFHDWYMNHVSRRLYKFFDGHMTLNRHDKSTLESWGIKDVHFIPSGIRVEKFLSIHRSYHAKLNFLSVGRYDTSQKGFDLSVQAIAAFNQKHPGNKAVFTFAGSGSNESQIADAARNHENVIDLGFVPYEKMPSLYSHADVFLLSSREEPFGLILIEAWASGVPVLATQTEGPQDMLRPGKNGWFIDSITSEGILRGIEQVYRIWLTTPQDILNMKTFCRKTGKKFSIDTTAARMRKLLQP